MELRKGMISLGFIVILVFSMFWNVGLVNAALTDNNPIKQVTDIKQNIQTTTETVHTLTDFWSKVKTWTTTDFKSKVETLVSPPDFCNWYKDVFVHAADGLAGWAKVLDVVTGAISALYGGVYAYVMERKMGICYPEKRLEGTAHCGDCNADPYMYCSKERCEMLGKCMAVPTETKDNYLCVAGSCDEIGIPKVNKMDAKWTEVTGVDHNIGTCSNNKAGCDSGSGDKLIWDKVQKDNQRVPIDISSSARYLKLTVKTDVPYSACRYAINQPEQAFDDMNQFDDADSFSQEHLATIPIGRDTEISTYNTDYTIYVKCKNPCGGVMTPEEDDYLFKFHLEDTPDMEAPKIEYIDPPLDAAVISTEQDQTIVRLQINKQGACFYSTPNQDMTDDPSKMIKILSSYTQQDTSVISTSNTQVADCLTRRGKKCYAGNLTIDLTKPQAEGTTINWDCIHDPTAEGCDAPSDWDSELSDDQKSLINDVQQNFNLRGKSEAYLFMFRCTNDIAAFNAEPEKRADTGVWNDAVRYMLLTVPPYGIILVKPEKITYYQGDEIPIEIQTSRSAECRYSIDKEYPWDYIENNVIPTTDGLTHTGHVTEQVNASTSGNGMHHVFYVKCRDTPWHLELTNSTEFWYFADVLPPTIIRMFTSSNNLIVETNEPASCVYNVDDQKKCNYDFKDGQPMQDSTEGYQHLANLNNQWTYYIKCKDRFNNTASAGSCTAIVKPYELPVY